MRVDKSMTRNGGSISYTPNKVASTKVSGKSKNKESNSYINYYPKTNKRSHTPMLNRKPKAQTQKRGSVVAKSNCKIKAKQESTSHIGKPLFGRMLYSLLFSAREC